MRFEEYMGRKVRVGDASPLREMWAKFVTAKREEMGKQERAERERKGRGLRKLFHGG